MGIAKKMQHQKEERCMHEERYQKNPNDENALQYLSNWHMERHSYVQARRFLGLLCILKPEDENVWFALCVSCAVAGELEEAQRAYEEIGMLLNYNDNDVRLKFCLG